ncbi:MAG: metal-dependent hydrolase [Actinomycetota bacterium]|nr:metal-dependent hydrolase [Actinomycetota bacterium]
MLFWHVGGTTAFVRYAFRDEAMDLRFLVFGALLPNLIDTPIAAAMWPLWQAPRLWSHSLLFSATVMVLVLLVTRRGPRRKQWMLLATGILLHIAFDTMWAEPETLWWPFLGWEFTRGASATFGVHLAGVLRNPWVWSGEAIGLLYLGYLWRASGLNDRRARHLLATTGRVSAPIDRR